MLKIYSDAAVSAKDCLAGGGLLVVGDGLYKQIKYPLNPTTDNHLAELEAFLHAVRWVVNNNYQDNWIVFHSDSQLVVTALHKNHIKNKQYINLFKSISRMLDDLAFYEIKWIPEKENKGADNMAKQALAKQRKK